MRTISSLLAVAGFSTGLIVACGGGLGSPSDSILGNDPIPNSGDPVGSSTDPSGSSTDPTGAGGCVCPVGTWKCGADSYTVSLKGGVCTLDQGVTIDCNGHFTLDGVTGSVKAQGSDLYACLGSNCATCTLKTITADDASVKDTGLPDMGIKDTSIPEVSKEAAVCPSSCASNLDCQNSCPSLPSGYLYCCDLVTTNQCIPTSGSTCP